MRCHQSPFVHLDLTAKAACALNLTWRSQHFDLADSEWTKPKAKLSLKKKKKEQRAKGVVVDRIG